MVVTGVVAVLALRATGAFDGLVAAGQPALPEQLAARVVVVLERAGPPGGGSAEPTAADPARLDPARQGHPLDTDPVRLVCAAKTFGFDPPEATTVDQVRVVYAHHMCAAVAPGLTWPGAIRVAGPLAVTLTEPATVRLPEQALPGVPDATQLDRVRSIIPERYHRQALAPDGLVDPDVAELLRTRFEAAIRNAQ